jgi:signal transduction histidine kinase
MSVLLVADGPVHFDSRAGDPNSEGLRTDCPPVQKFLVVPVRAHGKTIGGLCVGDRADALPFSTEDEEVMTMLAATAAVAIENARLYGELTRINEELEARVLDRTRQLEAVSEERTRYAEELRQVLDRNVRVQEAERRRIAQEIHDGVSQWLMGALFEIQAARVRLSLDMSEAHLHLQEAQRVLKFVKEEMRRVVYDLHPPLLESNGLVAAIRGYIADLETHTSQQYEFRVEGATQRLHPRQELALFRIAQEALNNVVQHADTSLAEVTLLFSPEGVCLRVTDSGPGFDPQQANDSGRPSLGLMSMHERASTVGGTLHIQSEPGEGAQVEVCVPAEKIWQRNDEPVISVEAERI